MNRCSKVVIGLGFGDEGKGRVVDSLCHPYQKQLVVRFSGGQQAGHTVQSNGFKHTFSNFGSGTLQKVPTYWSRHCSFDPVGFVNELGILVKNGHSPVIYIDNRCPVTTPYEKALGRMLSAEHGTCGVGVGQTFEREAKFHSILVGDLRFPWVLKIKLRLLANIYKQHGLALPEESFQEFLEICDRVICYMDSHLVDEFPDGFEQHIFEGSQGLLLDQNIGFFPHVTRSNTGTTNIPGLLSRDHGLILVTRSYQTRHGNGPMSNTDIEHRIPPNPHEINVKNEWQGDFRVSLLDLDLLRYGISRDSYIRDCTNKSLAITCLDQMKGNYRYTKGGKIISCENEMDFADSIGEYLGIKKVVRFSM